MVGLRDQRETIALEPLSQPDLPERFRAVEALGEDPSRQPAQLLDRARRRQRGVAHVIVDVEARVVDPERPPHLEPRERQLLAIAGDQMQARLDVLGELLARGRRALEDHDRAHVHV
jgi:hypothetical protein